jgi:predicted aspartyl protease
MTYVAVAILVCISAATAGAAPSWVPLAIDPAGAIIVHVRINDSGPFPFLLDTGASHSVMSDALIERLKLEVVARTTVVTSTGSEIRSVVRVTQTSIGSVRSENMLASVAPSAQLASIARGIEGIIGQDFLFSFNYTLDYRRRRLVWTDAALDVDGTRIPLVARRGRYLAQVPVRGNDTPALLVPDSGANGFVMFARNGRTRVPLESAPHVTSIRSVSGRRDVRTMMMRELRIGEVTLRDQPVAIIARDDESEGDGLLPLHLFASVSFNAREGYLLLRGSNGLRDALDDRGRAAQ